MFQMCNELSLLLEHVHTIFIQQNLQSDRLRENSLLQGLLAFLDAEPYYHPSVWNALLDKEKNGGGKDALLPLSALLKGLMLRRQLQDVGKWLQLLQVNLRYSLGLFLALVP